MENCFKQENANQHKSIQLLIATTDNKFLQRQYIPPFSDYLVINQSINLVSKEENQQKANIINVDTIGLSKSRNTALQKASADICLISDDDTTFFKNAPNIIQQAFSQHPRADILTFQYHNPDGSPAKKYASKPHRHNSYTIMKTSSVEIAFKRKSILDSGIKFDETFGLGAKFPTSEENIFLLDALKKGLKIHYIPIPILTHATMGSSGKDFSNINLIVAKGAVFYRMFGYKAYLVCLLFAIKKHALSKLNLPKFYQHMINGIQAYRTANG